MHIHNVHGDLLVTHEADGDHQYKGEDKQKEVDHDDFCKKKDTIEHLIHTSIHLDLLI